MTSRNPVDQPPSREWEYRQDELGIVYCLGRATNLNENEIVAAYYQTDREFATKQTLDNDAWYRRLIYQGLPEERQRLENVERPEVVERLLGYTTITQTGIYLAPSSLMAADPRHREVSTWLASEHPKAHAFQSALHIACMALSKAEVTLDELSLYGAASFGLVGTTNKIVDDVDVVFKASNLSELRAAIDALQSPYNWAEIDPYGRLHERRQLLKAKRWATSQIRLAKPYPLSIDLKVGRQPGATTLWEHLRQDGQQQPYAGRLHIINDSEGFCTSPAFQCEDESGHERVLLLEGYQYIGCAVAGDTVKVVGNSFADSPVIMVTQSEPHGVMPDFKGVPVS